MGVWWDIMLYFSVEFMLTLLISFKTRISGSSESPQSTKIWVCNDILSQNE